MDRRGFIGSLAALPFALGMSGSSKDVEADGVEVDVKDKKKCRWAVVQQNADESYMIRFFCGHLMLGSYDTPVDEPHSKYNPWRFCRGCGREVGKQVAFPRNPDTYIGGHEEWRRESKADEFYKRHREGWVR